MTTNDSGNLLSEREPGPVWGGWWMWEPPVGRESDMSDYFKAREIDLNLRTAKPELREAHGKPCPYCEKPMLFGTPNRPTRDHVIPRAHGATLRPKNRLIVCSPCNADKGHKTLEEFAQWLTSTLDSRAPIVWAVVEKRFAHRTRRQPETDRT